MTPVTVGSGLSFDGTTLTSTGSGGSVTSVDVSGGSTGLTTTGGPVTTAGTITLGGTLNVGNGGTGANAFSYGLLLSPGGTGALSNIATSSLGLLTTDVAEGTNQYFTNTRARAALSSSALGLSYDNTSGIFSLTSGYNIPLTASTTNWNNFFDTPSTRITAGTNLSWSGNTLNGISNSGIQNLFSATYPIQYSGGNFSLGFGTTTSNTWAGTQTFTNTPTLGASHRIGLWK